VAAGLGPQLPLVSCVCIALLLNECVDAALAGVAWACGAVAEALCCMMYPLVVCVTLCSSLHSLTKHVACAERAAVGPSLSVGNARQTHKCAVCSVSSCCSCWQHAAEKPDTA
jgi:hypothetical protein